MMQNSTKSPTKVLIVDDLLATPVDRPFSHPGWLFEMKLDGYRVEQGEELFSPSNEEEEIFAATLKRFPMKLNRGSIMGRAILDRAPVQIADVQAEPDDTARSLIPIISPSPST